MSGTLAREQKSLATPGAHNQEDYYPNVHHIKLNVFLP